MKGLDALHRPQLTMPERTANVYYLRKSDNTFETEKFELFEGPAALNDQLQVLIVSSKSPEQCLSR